MHKSQQEVEDLVIKIGRQAGEMLFSFSDKCMKQTFRIRYSWLTNSIEKIHTKINISLAVKIRPPPSPPQSPSLLVTFLDF